MQVDLALVQDTLVPDNISGPIQDARIAAEWNVTNAEKTKTEAKKAELDETVGKIRQTEQVVEFETQRLEGNIRAEQEKQVNELAAQTRFLVADLARQTAAIRADVRRKLGGAEARVVSRVGAVVAQVEVTDSVMPGVVSLPHGWGHDRPGTRMNVAAAHAGVNSNVLTDELVVDPLSGNAVLNGIPVEVSAV